MASMNIPTKMRALLAVLVYCVAIFVTQYFIANCIRMTSDPIDNGGKIAVWLLCVVGLIGVWYIAGFTILSLWHKRDEKDELLSSTFFAGVIVTVCMFFAYLFAIFSIKEPDLFDFTAMFIAFAAFALYYFTTRAVMTWQGKKFAILKERSYP